MTQKQISEFYVVVTKKIEQPLSNKAAEKIIRDIIDFNNWKVLGLNKISIITAIDLCVKYQIHYWDALLGAAMKQNDVNNIYIRKTSKILKKSPG